MDMNNCILITGASSGIGRALSLYYASPNVTLILTGRDDNRLEEVATACTEKGANVIQKAIDVTDQKAMEEWLYEVDTKHPIDLLIANAGIRQQHNVPTRDDVTAVLKTNLDGVLNTAFPLIPLMKKRGRGHIAVVSSLAAFRAYPLRAAYTASKAAVKMFCESWRIELAPYNIAVSTICPGFIKTPLTAKNQHAMPMIMEADKAAEIIANGLAKKKAIIAFPWPMYFFLRMLQCMPTFLSDFLVRSSYKPK
jgi:short-subunit dehydrogenase